MNDSPEKIHGWLDSQRSVARCGGGMNPTVPIARYRFTARMREAVRLPDYAGSLLRGQFGAALRHAACMTGMSRCTGCPLRATCPYTKVFEALPPAEHMLQTFSAIPNAYVMEPPPLGTRELRRGDALVFHMVLTGGAIEQLALIVFAWQRALARGLTASRSVAHRCVTKPGLPSVR